jgi:nitrogen-specific signal transduction histidine kinase/ActR/RegA family two-component response regulator
VSLREGPLLLILASDVTERNQMEKQVQQAQRLEAIGRLAGGVAHDFNNLLTVITGYVDILLMALPERHAMGAEITEIRKAADRASALTRQLLAFGRRQIAVPKVLDLNAVLGEMDGLLRRLLGADVDLRTSLEPSLGRIQADPVQVEQIVMNLAVNAREAMPRGGALSIETRNVHLDEARARRQEDLPPGPYVALAVRDTGAGMDEETQAHVFEPFFTTKERGTGLGLATVYGIVKHGGGHVSVESAPGLGTTMRIYFPRVEAPPGPPEGTSSSSAPPGCETILLVEDDDNVRALAGRFLRDRGYRVLEACDEEGALRAAELEPGAVHLLVADVMIPGRSGPDLARRLCELRPDTKVLHVSGYADEALARLGVREDGAPLLRKPFTADSLCLKVREVLDGGSPPRPAPREEEERDPEPALRPIPGAG